MATGPDRFQNFSDSLQLTLDQQLLDQLTMDHSPRDQSPIVQPPLVQANRSTPSPRVERRESESSSWVIRKMPRSWRLELKTASTNEKALGIRSSQKALHIHCALLRQITGLTLGSFSVVSLPTALIRATSPMIGSFHDRDLNPELTGSTPIERRLYNYALMETTKRYLLGEENWVSIEGRDSIGSFSDRWSEIIWQKDSQFLRQAFDQIILPLRRRDSSLVEDIGT